MSLVLQGTLQGGGNTSRFSRTFLTLRAGHARLTASIAREHEVMREALSAFRQVSSSLTKPLSAALEVNRSQLAEALSVAWKLKAVS